MQEHGPREVRRCQAPEELALTSFTLTSTRRLRPGLLTTEGAQHRKQRKMLAPVFSIAYLRGITPVFYETTHKVRL